jgi:formylglycine-generating enzyme required for sulfatase activity/serine/threonine protein phosphatase PrpC
MERMSPSRLMPEVWPVTDAGQAGENEDFVLVYQPSDPNELRYSGCLYVVADGAGGGRGQIVSRYAAQKVAHEYFNSSEPDLGLRLRDAVLAANADLFAYARQRPELVKMGAALVAAVVRGEQAHIASVGDSRAYLIREGAVHLITHDHTLVQQLVDEGAISPEEAREHPRRDVVLRMLGMEETVAVDVFDLRLRPDDALVLCSKGLIRALGNDEIAQIVANASPRNAAETLIRRAAEKGGKENMTVITALLRDGAPPLAIEVPYTWDGQPPSFESQPVLSVQRPSASPVETPTQIPRPTAQMPPVPPEPPAQAGDTVRAQPVQPPYPAQPAQPVYPSPPPEQWAQPYPAQPYPQRGAPQPTYTPPPGYAIDPATGLPPVPPSPTGWTGPQPAGYVPRTYQLPAQPASLRPPRRGITLGTFVLVAFLAVLLTVVMVVILVNPFNWQLPTVSLGGGTQPTATAALDQAALYQTLTVPAITPPTLPTTPPPVTPTPTSIVAPPGMVLIEGGAFTRGVSDEEAQAAILLCIQESQGGTCNQENFYDAQPVEQVTLSPFFIDVTEVTNRAYAACVAAEVCTPPSNQEFYADPNFAEHPVVYVTWEQARTYCEWTGGRLPTEAEWEKAARWDPLASHSNIWPWGDGWEPGRANTKAAGLGGTSAVQAFAQDVSPWGVLDMAGNVSEWVADWYYPGYTGLGTLNPTGPGSQPLTQPERVVRGGSFLELAAYSRAGHRLSARFDRPANWIGFRCVRDVVGAAPVATPVPSDTPAPTGSPAAGAAVTPAAPGTIATP